jgi:hypothetical protein
MPVMFDDCCLKKNVCFADDTFEITNYYSFRIKNS